MSIIKHRNFKIPYTQISNQIINDPRLSYKAKGILIYVLSKPPNWVVRVTDLINRSPKEGLTSIRSGISELLLAGYAELRNNYDKEKKELTGRYYLFYHKPLFSEGFREEVNKNKRFVKGENLVKK